MISKIIKDGYTHVTSNADENILEAYGNIILKDVSLLTKVTITYANSQVVFEGDGEVDAEIHIITKNFTVKASATTAFDNQADDKGTGDTL